MCPIRNAARPGDAGEAYPVYDALWHLVAMGLLDGGNPPAWPHQAPEELTRVAIIDLSVAVDHPNLEGAIDTTRAMDFFSTRLGALPYTDAPVAAGHIRAVPNYPGLPLTMALRDELTDRLANGSPPTRGIRPATGAMFSSHSTAICGLVGARPAEDERAVSAVQGGAPAGTEPLVLPYAGADPYAELIPISTSLDPDPEQMILAFLYAEMVGADIILLPRDIPDPDRSIPLLGAALVNDSAAVPIIDKDRALWAELSQLLVAMSQRIPIICAAGNNGEDGGIYPSVLAAANNGIVSVGAVNALGYPTGYTAIGALTVHAPSSDGERYDRGAVRLDRQAGDYRASDAPDDTSDPSTYSPLEIISTDVPGRGGYTGSRFRSPRTADDGIRDFGSFFCRFGGTSAASALAAGFLSTGITSGALPRHADPVQRGRTAKAWLISKLRPSRQDNQGKNVLFWTNEPAPP